MVIRNLTPHDITIRGAAGDTVLPGAGKDGSARVSVSETIVGDINGIPVVKLLYGDIVGLPEPEEGTVYLVSAMVLGRTDRRGKDVFGPDSGSSAVRNDKNQIVAVTRLSAGE